MPKRVTDREIELEEAMNRRIHQAMESYGPEGREEPGAWRRAEREASEEIAALTSFREQALNDLARLHLHPEEAQQNDWKLYGNLAEADRQIERVAREEYGLRPEEVKLADDIVAYARQHLGQAEGDIGQRFAHSIYQGDPTIDLSQSYKTDDPAKAEHRHAWALVNFDPFIQRAEDLGYNVERGNAIAARHHHGFEESEGFSQGVA